MTAGPLPLSAFLIDALPGVDVAKLFAWSTALTAVAFVAVGAVQGVVVEEPWWRSALRTALIGGSAAGLAFAVGLGVGRIV